MIIGAMIGPLMKDLIGPLIYATMSHLTFAWPDVRALVVVALFEMDFVQGYPVGSTVKL